MPGNRSLTSATAHARYRDILRRYHKGETLAAIGDAWQISKQRVLQILQQEPESAGNYAGRPRKQGVERWANGKIKYAK